MWVLRIIILELDENIIGCLDGNMATQPYLIKHRQNHVKVSLTWALKKQHGLCLGWAAQAEGLALVKKQPDGVIALELDLSWPLIQPNLFELQL